MTPGTRIGTYEVISSLGAGGPSFARSWETRASYGGSSGAMERTWL
jgi:hypothetical protein